MFKALIFDVDGVLIDSVDTAYRVKAALVAKYGININTVPDPHNEAHKGSSITTFLKAVKERHNVEIDEQQFKRDAVAAVHQDLLERKVAADPDLILFLEDLRKHGIICAITTSGLRDSVENKLRILGIKEYFKLIVTADDCKAHKPSPEPYLYTIERLGLKPKDCLIIEDSLTGVQAALASKTSVIGFTKYGAENESLEGTIANSNSWEELSYPYLEELAKLIP